MRPLPAVLQVANIEQLSVCVEGKFKGLRQQDSFDPGSNPCSKASMVTTKPGLGNWIKAPHYSTNLTTGHKDKRYSRHTELDFLQVYYTGVV